MKKALLALALASVISLGAASGTFAQYSQELKSGTNIITAQSVDFTGDHLAGTNTVTGHYQNSISATNAAPGSNGGYSFTVKNGNTFSYDYTIALSRTLVSRNSTNNFSNTIFTLWKLVGTTYSATISTGLTSPAPTTLSVTYNNTSSLTSTALFDALNLALANAINNSGLTSAQITSIWNHLVYTPSSSTLASTNNLTNTIVGTNSSSATTDSYMLTYYWPLSIYSTDNTLAQAVENFTIDVNGTQSTAGPDFQDVR